jgi:tetratricopeptide (TPR) repeat protein
VPSAKLHQNPFYYYQRYRYLSDSSALNELIELAKDQAVRPVAQLWIGHCYSTAGLMDKAVDWFRQSLQSSQTPEESLNAARALSLALYQLGNVQESHSIIQAEIERELDHSSKSELYLIAASPFASSISLICPFIPNSSRSLGSRGS